MSKRPYKFEDEVFVSGSLARLVVILLVRLVKDMQSTDIRMLVAFCDSLKEHLASFLVAEISRNQAIARFAVSCIGQVLTGTRPNKLSTASTVFRICRLISIGGGLALGTEYAC